MRASRRHARVRQLVERTRAPGRATPPKRDMQRAAGAATSGGASSASSSTSPSLVGRMRSDGREVERHARAQSTRRAERPAIVVSTGYTKIPENASGGPDTIRNPVASELDDDEAQACAVAGRRDPARAPVGKGNSCRWPIRRRRRASPPTTHDPTSGATRTQRRARRRRASHVRMARRIVVGGVEMRQGARRNRAHAARCSARPTRIVCSPSTS